MSEDHRSEQLPPAGLQPDDRLDSWKEIAAFLHRDVRTVQRWEKYVGLPVHRHAESRLRTAYAYRSELEAWWRTQRTTVEPAETGVPDPDGGTGEMRSNPAAVHGFPRLARPAGLIAGILIGIVGIGSALWLRPARTAPPVPAVAAPIPVVLARFEDRVGNPQLVAAIEEAVARQLTSDRHLEAVAPARVARTLRLMRREPNAPVTEALGRELALRDPPIRYVITGGVHMVATRYFADVRAIDADGRAHASLEWQADTPDQLVSQSREMLGEFPARTATAAAQAVQPAALERVTSSSTAAVRLYTAALQAAGRGQWGASELLARRAVLLDAEFSSAHAWLGWTLRRQGRSAREALPPLERARLLSGMVTDQETYLIAGMFHAVAGDLRSAAAALEALRRLDPTHRQALDILIEVCWRMGRVRRAVELSGVRAEMYPDDFYANVRAAHAFAAGKGSTERAAAFADRAKQLASPEAVGDRPTWNAWLHVLPVFQRWVGGDIRGALDALDVLDRSLADRLGRERDAFAAAVGFAHLAFGRTEGAERAFRYGSSPDRQLNLAVLALTQGDEEGARRWLRQVRDHSAQRPSLFARVGFTKQAERGLEALLPSDHAEGNAAVTRGLLALRAGQMESAMAFLREGLDLLRSSGEPAYFFAAEALAAIADSHGDVGRSIRLLTEASAERAHTYALSQWTAAYWIRMNADLVRQCRRAGRHDEAERISAGLQQILHAGEHRQQPPGVSPAVR